VTTCRWLLAGAGMVGFALAGLGNALGLRWLTRPRKATCDGATSID
jgi:hypothetical protein